METTCGSRTCLCPLPSRPLQADDADSPSGCSHSLCPHTVSPEGTRCTWEHGGQCPQAFTRHSHQDQALTHSKAAGTPEHSREQRARPPTLPPGRRRPAQACPQLPSELPQGQSFMPCLDPRHLCLPREPEWLLSGGGPPLHKAGVGVPALYSRKSHVTYSQPSPPTAPHTRVPYPWVQPTKEPEVLQCLPLRNSHV